MKLYRRDSVVHIHRHIPSMEMLNDGKFGKRTDIARPDKAILRD